MDPSNFQKSGTRSLSKIVKLTNNPRGAARSMGPETEMRSASKTFKPALISHGIVNSKGREVERSSSSKTIKPALVPPRAITSNRREVEMQSASRATKHALVPPGGEKEIEQGIEMRPASKIAKPTFIKPGALMAMRRGVEKGSSSNTSKPAFIPPSSLQARARGALGSFRVRPEHRPPMEDGVPPSCDPMEDDMPRDFDAKDNDIELPQEVEVTQENQSCPRESGKEKRKRGPNRCTKLGKLKAGEKLRVTFYHNRVVGEHASIFARHLGMLVRDGNICPVRVHSWAEIGEDKMQHMWVGVKEKFDSDDMTHQRGHILGHMKKLWENWRSSLHCKVKSKPLRDVLKDVPERVDKSDWEWLVREHSLSEKFKETSTRNAGNRSKLTMPHRTGSMHIREVIYQLGGKNGNPPNAATVFLASREKGGKLVEQKTKEKYAEIQEVVQTQPSLTNFEVMERCFGPQLKGHVIGFGGGITAKELKDGNCSKVALLDQLNASKQENESLKKRVDQLEVNHARLETKLNQLTVFRAVFQVSSLFPSLEVSSY